MAQALQIPPPDRALQLVRQATEFGRDQILVALGEKRRTVSRNKAIELVGSHFLKVWEKAGLIKGYKHSAAANAKLEYDLLRLHELQTTETYCYFLGEQTIDVKRER